MDIMFILHAEHEMNCSTAAARHLASSGVDVYTAIAGDSWGIKDSHHVCLGIWSCLHVCLSACLAMQPSVGLTACLFVCLPVCCSSVYASVCLPACLPACLLSVDHLSMRSSVCSCVTLSACTLSVCLSVRLSQFCLLAAFNFPSMHTSPVYHRSCGSSVWPSAWGRQ